MNIKFVKQIFLIFLCIPSISSYSEAQDNQNKNSIDINPIFVVTDLQFALQTLNTIELKGSEVNAYIEVKGILREAIEKALKLDLKPEDSLEVPMPVLIGKNVLNLLERVTLASAHAENYMRFTSALIKEINRVESGMQLKK